MNDAQKTRFRVMPPIEQHELHWTVYRGGEVFCLCPTHDAAWMIAESLDALHAVSQRHPPSDREVRDHESFDGEQ